MKIENFKKAAELQRQIEEHKAEIKKWQGLYTSNGVQLSSGLHVPYQVSQKLSEFALSHYAELIKKAENIFDQL